MVLGRNICLNVGWMTGAWAPHFAMRLGIDDSTFVLIHLRSTHERSLGTEARGSDGGRPEGARSHDRRQAWSGCVHSI